MTVLRLEPVHGAGVDAAVSAVDAVVLARRPDGRFADVALADVARFTRALAFAGISASPCTADLVAPTGAIASIGRDLGPLPDALLAADVVRVRRLPLGEATAELLRRRTLGLRPAPPGARDRCRSLLRGEDVVLAWSRRAWGTRRALRARAARSRLRPVVFDHEAAGHPELTGRAFARDGALGRWLFG